MDDDLSIAQDFKSMITSTAKSAAEEKTTAVRQAIATSDSANGKVKVKLSGITISGDDSQDIEVKDGTGTGVFKGDTVSVMLSGTDPTALYVIARGKQMSNLLDQTSNVANDAKSTADTASTKADTAQNTADTATTKANDAKSTADEASSKATDAQNTANTISGDLTSFIKAMNKTVDGLQSQIDGSIQTWFYEIPPTNENVPAKDWTTTDLKNNHLGDLYYDTKTGYCYRYQVENNTYSWQRVTDVDVTKALSDAAKAQDTADHKRRVFTITPTPPYDIGDLWTDGKDLRRCNTEKTSEQSYISTDWELATTYTDDTVANKALNKAKLTDQHFWTDDSGAHISTGAEKDTSGAHVDINSELQAFKIGDTVYAGYGKDGEFCYDENGVIYNQAGLFSGGKINDELHSYANPVVLDHVCGDIKSISGYISFNPLPIIQ
jgi:FKBP-type peptidyl-prolyl cis-trans isomerase